MNWCDFRALRVKSVCIKKYVDNELARLSIEETFELLDARREGLSTPNAEAILLQMRSYT